MSPETEPQINLQEPIQPVEASLPDVEKLVRDNFETLQKLHFLSEANLFGVNAPYFGALVSILNKYNVSDSRSLALLDDEVFKQYLREVNVKPEFHDKIIEFSRQNSHQKFESCLQLLEKDKLLKLVDDIRLIALTEPSQITSSIDNLISDFKPDISTNSPRLSGGENDTGPFFKILSSGITAALSSKALKPEQQKQIVLYSLLDSCGLVSEYNNPIFENIGSEEDLEKSLANIQKWDQEINNQSWSQGNEVIGIHFLRQGAGSLRAELSKATFDETQGCLIDKNNYKPLIDPDKKTFGLGII